MGIEITQHFDFQALTDFVRVTQGRRRAAFERAIEDAKTEIDVRATSGLTTDGRLIPLSPEYRERKKAAVGRDQPDRTGIPTAHGQGGEMLRSIHTRFVENGEALEGEIYCTTDQAAKLRRNHQLRPFFELTKAQKARIKNKVEKA